jgi:pyruvate dehydrogenase E1 component
VPIVADEARTFGMEGLFRQIGIYAPFGQKYKPVDADQLMYYREEERPGAAGGHQRAGRDRRWMAAGTSYSVSNVPMLPFYIYYSMFGFQRVGDIAWQAADMRTRGFLLGGTAGRTTLNGEGLQHEDGFSHRGRRHPQRAQLRPDLRLRSRGDPAARHAGMLEDQWTSTTTSP